jgi:hypothetical protein
MGLSRLDNFLKSSRGTILYVNPNDLDATDSIENRGNSLTRPFKTIQRALIESARFSYQRGLNNDRFGKTTILVYPGDHIIDNRPGFIPDGLNNFRLRNGTTTNNLPAFDLNSNFDLTSPDNELYKLNSIHGGVIIPRGTSIVGLDLRKTKIRPKYVPNPVNDNIERSTIFRVTGACYFWQFSFFDADPNDVCYKDYTANIFVPNFSHHKLSCFEYADGTNAVNINDEFQTYSTDRTDLDMYYEKISLVYGQSSGRAIEPDYPSSGLDIEPKIDEFRIVGSTGLSVGITSIRSGDGVTPSTTVTVTTSSSVDGLDVDTPFRIENISTDYNGQFVVTEKLSSTEIVYNLQTAPIDPLPSVSGATLSLQSDTVTSASPYIFNISLRSVFGMCGVLADGNKASGFKSMVIAQFTGIGLQKDDNAFVVYNSDSPPTGQWDDVTVPGNETISNNSRAVFKPEYRNFHIKATNDAFIQNVSIFAIGYAEQFVTENGGDMSITNSNSNFGAKALVASGFRKNAFLQDDVGYITHIIPPKEVPLTENSIEFQSIDVVKTGNVAGVGSTAHLYLYGQTNSDLIPENVIDGYRIGARENDTLRVLVSYAGSVTEYSSRIVMPGSNSSSEKSFNVKRSALGINSIGQFSVNGSSNVITLSQAHTFINGESVRVLGETGQIPDGLTPNTIYYAITTGSGISTNTDIKLAKTLNDAINDNSLIINEKGGLLKVVSRVSDKNSGDIGHPIQYDSDNNHWYIKVSSAATENTIYSTIVSLGTTYLGAATPRTYVKRRKDSRASNDTLYRLRYVIPANSGGTIARPPVEGFILQESNTSIGSTTSEIQTYFGSGSLSNPNQQRNFRFISNATWDGTTATITTELPHDLTVGSSVELVNIKSTLNTTGSSDSGFNRTFVVSSISNSKEFNVGLSTDPGTFTSDTSSRNTSLPYFKRKNYENIYYIYRQSEAQKYIAGEQDGIYYLTILNSSNSPTVTPFTDEKFSQPVKELFPQTNRDNPESDPEEAKCFSSSSLIGEVVVNDVRNSITKETINKIARDSSIGVGLTDIVSYTGTAHTIYTSIDHGLNRITGLSIVSGGSGYGSGSAGDIYNARLVAIGASTVGKHATAKITVDGSGTITAVKIMDGGSAYGIGNTLAVVGVSTYLPYTEAVVQVDSVYNNVGDSIKVIGVSSESYSSYNNIYRITGIDVGQETLITVSSASTVGNISTTGIGVTVCQDAYTYLTGETVRVSSLVYNNNVGIATLTTANAHGFVVDQKVRIGGAGQSLYNGSFVVNEVNSLTSFSVVVGISTNSPTATGTIYAYHEGISSNDGIVTADDENLSGRMVPTYAGITTTLSADIISATAEEIYLQGVGNLNVNIGDYFMVDDEIIRIKTTTTGSNPVLAFRGILGSNAGIHSVGSVVRKIDVNPIELRRHSISRASGHTFEYVGYGPGNYSTAFPDKQDRQISAQEELLAQSTRRAAGINFYTGMNDKGISYSGNKKLSTITGREEIFDTPVQTVTGEDIGSLPNLNITEPVEGIFSRSIKVEGGNDGKATSEFNGPVIINNKLTVNSEKGFESNTLFLQGDATVSRKYTVGIATPALAGNPGDVVYYANPNQGGYVGWVYTLENDWKRFGHVSISGDLNIGIFDSVGIATTTPGECKLKVGSGTSLFCVDSNGVGIATTANTFKLHVNGNTNIIGTCYANYFSGDGSGLTNLNASATGWTVISGGIYNTSLNKVGIGTSVPTVNLELGSIGSAVTSIRAHGIADFVGILTAKNVHISGVATVTGSYNLINTSGRITAGIITSTNIRVGTGATTLMTSGINVGIGTTSPRAKLDVEGHVRFKSYSENVDYPAVTANQVTIDLSKAQSFICTATSTINNFVLTNIPSDSTSFTIRIQQDSTGGRSVGIDTFRTIGGVSIPVYWPGGGILPGVTTTANRSDIYSFKTFDGNNITTAGLYGVVGGQNFA